MPTLSSKARKEEAELRKIAKHSRLARKEAAIRERRKKQKEQRQRQSERATDITPAAPETAPRKRLGAIILPTEVRELQQRLLLSGNPTSISGHGGDDKDNDKNSNCKQNGSSSSSSRRVSARSKKTKTNGVKGGGSAVTTTTTSTTTTSTISSPQPGATPKVVSSSCVSSCPRFEEPPHNVEVHHKNRQVLVNVTLHHVPPQHIDVSETNERTLIVDTSRHTKKYRLELLMPEGIRIDTEQTSCELDSALGVLKCVLPIKNEIPVSLQEERARLIETIRKQRALRFHMDTDGDLKVRTRRALLAKNEQAQALLRSKNEAAKEIGRRNARDDAKSEVTTTATGGGGVVVEGREELQQPRKRAKKEGVGAAARDNAAGKSSAKDGADRVRQEQQPQRKNNVNTTGDVFSRERQRALELAKSTGKAAQVTLRERIAQAKARQRALQERLSVRSSRRVARSERTQDAFSRILDEQKRQLLEKAQLNASIAAVTKEKNPASRKSAGKRVTFAVA